MATVNAFCHNSAIHAFHNRLCRCGKPRRLALIAAMHKLLLILNAVIRDQFPWKPNRVPAAAEV